MRKIALVNQKGGVGKTTTAVNLSDALSRLDRRVLLIDLDPQSNATISLGIPPTDQKNTTYAILNGDAPNPIEISPHLHLIPSSIDLAGAESELAVEIGRETILRDALSSLSGYDFIILDCSPSLGLLSINALTYVTEVMVPLQCEFLALHGISLLTRTVDLIRKRLNPDLEIKGVIPCMYDVRKGLARETVAELQNYFKGKVFKTRIRTNVRLAEAPSHGLTIFEYAPDSNGAEDYLALAREIVGIEPIVREEAPAVPDCAEDPAPPPVVEGPLARVEAPLPLVEAASPLLEAQPEAPPPA